jgi:branched-chain amino acid transport system ATP-binding protein
MLTIEHLDAGYRRTRVLYDVTLSIGRGETVGVLGPNGAGKTTLLRAIAGNCNVYAGRLEFGGSLLNGKPDYVRASLGIAHVPEGRRTWPSLTVEENLLMGAWRLPHKERNQEARRLLEYVLGLFPRLAERIKQRAAILSGGEQQMLAIGRALMSKPSLLLVDEPSIGLAPIMMEAVMEALRRLRRDQYLSIMLVEQRVQDVLDFCDRIHILSRGRIVESMPAAALTRDAIEAAYFERR